MKTCITCLRYKDGRCVRLWQTHPEVASTDTCEKYVNKEEYHANIAASMSAGNWGRD